jgi:hypothetical protein
VKIETGYTLTSDQPTERTRQAPWGDRD